MRGKDGGGVTETSWWGRERGFKSKDDPGTAWRRDSTVKSGYATRDY